MWFPVSVSEFLLQLMMPWFLCSDEVKIEVKNGQLTVSGSRKRERNEESEKDGVKFLRM